MVLWGRGVATPVGRVGHPSDMKVLWGLGVVEYQQVEVKEYIRSLNIS